MGDLDQCLPSLDLLGGELMRPGGPDDAVTELGGLDHRFPLLMGPDVEGQHDPCNGVGPGSCIVRPLLLLPPDCSWLASGSLTWLTSPSCEYHPWPLA